MVIKLPCKGCKKVVAENLFNVIPVTNGSILNAMELIKKPMTKSLITILTLGTVCSVQELSFHSVI